jgi:hypothetical protein
MASGDSSSSGQNNNDVHYDYGTSDDKKSDSSKAPRFNGNPEEFFWWKTNMYSHIMGLDDELRDIFEDGVGDLALDEEGAAIDRKKHTPAQKKLYKKHHKIRGILVASIPRREYMKMSDKESEEESHDGDSDEDSAVVEKMAMLSNKLQYLAKKNKKFLSRSSGYIGSKKEDHKSCFNCKKPGHFIADCPDLQKEKSKEKSKKPTFKSNKY